ncbi:hypothetical protein [Bacteroides xylanisolvens]|uniref:hypothetical protein n=1 Tax=Bacteroides xylanisolvens TaxID=371601 RepID=UPI002165B5D9|nr:hypothetical protein [Bacteroides xylanisolvens]MCS3378535.1 hypothetical protein [Bacteroides xylanisolvens]
MRTKWREQQAKARVHSLVQELKHLPGQPQKKRRDRTFPMSLVEAAKTERHSFKVYCRRGSFQSEWSKDRTHS